MSRIEKKIQKKYKKTFGEEENKREKFNYVLPKSKNNEEAGTLDNEDDFEDENLMEEEDDIIEDVKYDVVEYENTDSFDDENVIDMKTRKEVSNKTIKENDITRRKQQNNYNSSKTEYKSNSKHNSSCNDNQNQSSIFDCIPPNYIGLIVFILICCFFGKTVLGIALSLISTVFQFIAPILKYTIVIAIGLYLYSKFKGHNNRDNRSANKNRQYNKSKYSQRNNSRRNNYRR